MNKRWAGIAMGTGLLLVAGTALAVHQSYRGYPIVRVMVNSNPVSSDVPAVIMDGRTLLPVRAVAEALHATVEWDPLTSTVYLTTRDGAIEPDIARQARAAIAAIKAADWSTIASLAHPDKGVRFSPYAFTRTGGDGDVVFWSTRLRAGFTDRHVYTWGSHDGSGEPIRLTFEEYYRKFIYNADFAAAPVVTYNRIAKSGNTRVNIHEAYPNAQYVEYHFPGFDPQREGMDWQSLRLVFEEKAGNWFLVGVIHDQWTI